jgi:hypothetical protein
MEEKDLQSQLNEFEFPAFGATATTGVGVFETLKVISKMVLLNLKGGLK